MMNTTWNKLGIALICGTLAYIALNFGISRDSATNLLVGLAFGGAAVYFLCVTSRGLWLMNRRFRRFDE